MKGGATNYDCMKGEGFLEAPLASIEHRQILAALDWMYLSPFCFAPPQSFSPKDAHIGNWAKCTKPNSACIPEKERCARREN